MLLDERPQGELARDDREEVEARDELEVFEEAEVTGVGHGDRESTTLTFQGQYHTLGRHVGRDQLEDLGVDFEPGKIDGGHAMLPRQDLGDLDFGDEAQLHQHEPEPVFRGLLLYLRLGELLPGKETFPEKHFTELIGATSGRCGCHDRDESL